MTTIQVGPGFVAAKADEIMSEIDDTIADENWRNSQGQRMPPWVSSFSQLHDYVDANCYGGFCDDGAQYVLDGRRVAMMSDPVNDFINAVQSEVGRRLAERAVQGHRLCPPRRHTFDPGDLHYEGAVDQEGRTRCNDCGEIMFYCTSDEDYHHAAAGTPACGLIRDDVPTGITPPDSCLAGVPERCAIHDRPVIGGLCATMRDRCEGCGAVLPVTGMRLCHACAGAGVPVRIEPPAGMSYPIKLGELDGTGISALAATLAGALDDSEPGDADIREQVSAARDSAALDEIAEMLRDPDWGTGMLEDIAQIVQRAGRDTATRYDADGEPVSTWARH